MKTKIVYTLVCGHDDVYLAQAAISAYTAKKHNPAAYITLVVDEDTSSIIEKKSGLTVYFSEIIIVQTPEGMNKMQRSRYLKTTLRKHVSGDFLYIDTDTVVVDDLSGIDNESAVVAAVLDRHLTIDQHPYKEDIAKKISVIGLTLEDISLKYFNSGVMFVKDTPDAYAFYNKWHSFWEEEVKKGKSIDQPPLAKANKDCGYIIQELGGEWNCQMVDNFLNYLPVARILHYFGSDHQSPYLLYDDILMGRIIKLGHLSEEVKCMLENPRRLFVERHLVAYKDDLAYFSSNLHMVFMNHRWIYNFFEYVSSIIVKKSLLRFW